MPGTSRLWLSLAVVLAWISSAPAASPPLDSLQTERLSGLCKLWGHITYFHPFLAYRPIDFDSAFAEAVPKVLAATSRDDYIRAVSDLLSVLDDPATHVLVRPPLDQLPDSARNPVDTQWRRDSVLLITLDYPSLGNYGLARQLMDSALVQARNATGLIVYLGPITADPWNEEIGVYTDAIINKLVASLLHSPLSMPGNRVVQYDGYPAETGGEYSGYTMGFLTSNNGEVLPSDSAVSKPAVFVTSQGRTLPPEVVALQDAGQASIVSSETSVATTGNTFVLDIADSVQVSIRMAELVRTDGRIGASPDTVLAAQATREEALAAAALLLRELPRAGRRTPHEFSAVPARHVSVERFASTVYPPLGYRVLAAAKIWMVINYFYPYKDLMQEDWDRVLLTYLPRFTAAADSLEYALAVAEMYAHLHDSHGFMVSSVLGAYYGMAIPPCLVRMIEGRPVITLLLDDSLCHSAGIELGDIVLTVDGKDVEAKLSGLRRLLAASTPGALELDAASRLLRGPDSSEIVLKLKKQGGQVTTVRAQRQARFYGMRRMTERMDSDTFRMLDKDIGYVDLDRLETAQVDAVFDEFKDTKAIIFDMRGYPHGTAWFVAPRLLEQTRVHAAGCQLNVVSAAALQLDSPDLSGGMRETITQDVVKSKESAYRGLTVMLIDERTISQAEHTGLFLYAANQTKFVGSNSAGANGNVTNFVIPGSITLWLTGLAVRFADGRQLQRIGIVPDVEVKPTIKGIGKKRDEVLERAHEYLKQRLKGQRASNH